MGFRLDEHRVYRVLAGGKAKPQRATKPEASRARRNRSSPTSSHSYLRAVTGSTRVALMAGTRLAAMAAASMVTEISV
jgi:hypothetical protein